MIDNDVVSRLKKQVSDRLAERFAGDREAGEAGLSQGQEELLGRELIDEVLRDYAQEQIRAGRPVLGPDDEDLYAQAIDDAIFGMAKLQRLLADETIENIDVNGHDQVWITRADGRTELGPAVADSDAELEDLIRTAAARMGQTERRFDRGQPWLNLQLRDGSRLFAVMTITGRPCLSVRRHRFTKLFIDDLVGLGTIDYGLREFLAAAVKARKNLIISGGTNSGKTTTLRALANEIPPHERLVTIEDSYELGLDRFPELHPNVVAMEEREGNVEGTGAISLAQMVRMGLRMNPSRVIVGEVRGDEVLPMLNAMSQGNDGSMCTVHANSSKGAFSKLAMYAVQAPERLAMDQTNMLVANAIDLVVFIGHERAEGRAVRRFVSSVREVVSADGDMIVSNEVFEPGPDRRAVPGVPLRQGTLEDLEAHGYDASLFERRDGWWTA